MPCAGWGVYKTEEDCLQAGYGGQSPSVPPAEAQLPVSHPESNTSTGLPGRSDTAHHLLIQPQLTAILPGTPDWAEMPDMANLPDWAQHARRKARNAQELRLPSTVIPSSANASSCWVVLSSFPNRTWCEYA